MSAAAEAFNRDSHKVTVTEELGTVTIGTAHGLDDEVCARRPVKCLQRKVSEHVQHGDQRNATR